MPYGIETVAGAYTAAATATAQAYTAATNQSFTVRALNAGTTASIEALWSYNSAAGGTRIRSPRLHDDVVGCQVGHFASNASLLAAENFNQQVYSQDTLIVEDLWAVAPAAVAQQMCMQVYYDDVPGISANFKTWAEVQPLIQSYYGVYVNPSSAAAITGWGAGQAINANQDNFKANSWYALIGYVCPSAFTAWSVTSTDLGNLQVGGPGSIDPLLTRNFFPKMETYTGKPSIPVINSQNKGSTLVQVISTALSTAYYVWLLFAYLGPTGA